MDHMLTFALLVAVAVTMVHCASYRTIQTPSGPVRGIGVQDKVYQYRRIPYAKPPVGDLRLRKPVPYGRWTNTLDATIFGPSCYQNREYLLPNLPNNDLSEDCLHLNIYTPYNASRTNRKSVMVWVHGGGYLVGQATMYDGSILANIGDVIVVTLNYRLGFFGFLSTMDSASRGNYGLWDQLLAIKWVKDNIESFGGKTDSITIFGESAGSMSVALHAINPSNQGLFQRVIAESGPANSILSLTLEPKNVARAYGVSLNCINANDVNFDTAMLVQCVRGKSVDDLSKAQNKMDTGSYTKYTFTIQIAPVVDGELIDDLPETVLANSSSEGTTFFRSLDVIFGNTNTEGSLILSYLKYVLTLENDLGFNSSRAIPNSALCNALSSDMSADLFNGNSAVTDGICKKYSSTATLDQSNKILNMYTDAVMVAPTVRTLDTHSSPGLTMGRSTFQYMFTRTNPNGPVFTGLPTWVRGAPHGAELEYLFGSFGSVSGGMLYNSPDDERLSVTMVKYWTNFAKFGSPNSPGLPHWPRYDPVARLYQKLDTTISPDFYYTGDRVEFWNNYLPSL